MGTLVCPECRKQECDHDQELYETLEYLLDQNLSPENKLQEILDPYLCWKTIQENGDDEVAILCQHYSINVQRKYDDVEELDWDLYEFEKFLNCTLLVSEYDDLIAEI